MEERLRELWDYYAGRADRQDQTVIVELLREVQEICGCVPSNQQREAARVCGVPESLIAALVKRYPSLREADYRHEITACSGERCRAKGAAAVLDALRRELGIESQGLSADGMFFLRTQNCLKHCGTAPSLLIDGELLPRVTPEQIPALIQRLRLS